ncbi:MAG: MFS transporter [Thermoprotei archaeon]
MSSKALDELPMTLFQWKVTLLSSMGMFMDGYVLTIFSTAFPIPKWGLSAVFLPTSVESGLMASASLIGMFFGAFTFGHLADRFGRKKTYTYDLAMTALFLLLTALAVNWLEFFFLEIGAGIGIGADYPISSSIQTEFSPRNKRGMLLVINIFSWTIGSIVFLLLSIPFYSLGPISWRVMYASAALIPLIVVASRNSLPETPSWLLLKGKKQEAEKSAEFITRETGASASEAVANLSVQSGSNSIRDLFSKEFLTLTIFSSLAWFAYDFSSYGIWNFTPSIFVSTTTYTMAILATLLEEIPVFVGFAICVSLVERKGRRLLQELGFLGAGVSLVAFSIYSYLVPGALSYTALAFSAFALMHVFHNIGPTNLTYAYPSEIFPTRLRGTAHGFATTISRLGGILGTIAVAVGFFSYNLSVVLIVVSIFEFLGFAVTYLWAPEVKGKKLL